MTLSDLEII